MTAPTDPFGQPRIRANPAAYALPEHEQYIVVVVRGPDPEFLEALPARALTNIAALIEGRARIVSQWSSARTIGGGR